ncbi:MAG: hypothetical protein CMG25_00875 [Candidatus Marinimicrobia bacterium]|nr:hypothetical protein [Candidatus Neomarinimicrobiota bacterium]|tara:strand:+ start:2656 stop:3873 length:1218 start_codon:yes stop_codon:yes gene_type:complete
MIILFLALTGIILSIFFSSCEIALISANKLQINVWVKQKMRLSKTANSIINNKEFYLFCILVGNNLANMLTTSFLTILLINHGYFAQEFIFVIIALIILLFAEIIPKSIVRQFSNVSLLAISPLLYVFGIILYPFYYIFNIFFSSDISKNSIFKNKEHDYLRDDIQYIYEHVDKSIKIEEEQKEMLSNVFMLGESTASEVMTPRTDLSMVSKKDSLENILHTFIDSGHSKLPVYDGDIDNIIGIIYLYDLFKNPNNIDEIIKNVNQIPFSKNISDIMSEFRDSNCNVSIVLDEHGGTMGIITAEDIFEELFGDFEDEFDHDDIKSKINKDGSITTNAKIECNAFNKKYNNLIPEGNYETLAGYIISEIGRIPNEGENLFLSIGQVVIKKSSSRKVDEIQIFPNKL